MNDLEKKLWDAADDLRANSELTSAEYKTPVLGLVFLRFVDHKFSQAENNLKQSTSNGRGPRPINKDDYKSQGVLYIPETSRYKHLLELPEGSDIGNAVGHAMSDIENENPELRGILPKDFSKIDSPTLSSLLRTFSDISLNVEGDLFGKVYEYFLGSFALEEGADGGEFFTPTSLVRLIVEIIEPFKGLVYDPACGSGGMFVQSADFVKDHQKDPSSELSIYGQEKTAETVRLSRMSLAIQGLQGDIKQGNTYYDDIHDSVGKFDFVMANPPFNVDKVDKERIADDPRFPLGIPNTDNANYLWIQNFWSALNEKGRAGFVMANSASDARNTELEIRKQIVNKGSVDVMVSIGTNFFMNVTLPCTLWFFDKGKSNTERSDKVLFIDAREIFTQVDRTHREFTPEQIEFISNIVRLYRGMKSENSKGSDNMMLENFPDLKYKDVVGLCKVSDLNEIKEQGYSLNPARYVGVNIEEMDDKDFYEKISELNDELQGLNKEASKIEENIHQTLKKLTNDN